jgi:putative membrane protein
MMWGHSGMGGWSWGFGALVVIGVVILIIVLLRRQTPPRVEASPTPPMAAASTATPKQILDERYAKGELTTEEYRERIAALGLDT